MGRGSYQYINNERRGLLPRRSPYWEAVCPGKALLVRHVGQYADQAKEIPVVDIASGSERRGEVANDTRRNRGRNHGQRAGAGGRGSRHRGKLLQDRGGDGKGTLTRRRGTNKAGRVRSCIRSRP